ncbi:uncharacterized protein LOC128449563 [Pleuronectes platessa]|uniref:uncharacterized protein LOC128449563 n=1 Tax=Pleuronectes platessa TaxID=8262 RepID=UPI00232A54C8|nr:uncharacterized protein LOC128449563 [Pleuronectes platessa]XP_053288777.1 uncharacterized protein LOC128449563 [Pleuronectes platessa]XP_053288778.1 uncharacterized protein LOC128449563 [Pleuronectes platessa]XP_053288779.1 uncharacterized protein LOC128449563 [Pleuronectes platessa]XP_053288780.1 uncharacterized protein LOC128449563 [Pleuronectes platessa]
MSVTLTKEKEVTVITIKADNKSLFPPLWQILRALCTSAVCCSVNHELMKPSVSAILGTIQIMSGMFNMALGPGRPSLHPLDLTDIGASYWLGVLYAAAGITSILAGQYPSPCLAIFTVIMNMVGAVFAFTGIVLYSIELQDIYMGRVWGWSHYDRHSFSLQSLLVNAEAVSVLLAVLQLCVCIGVAVVGIKAVIVMKKKEAGERVGHQQPELQDMLLSGSCA